ncbi:MAG TPA: hypothetical protein VHC22_17905 [Pirellulales bacterium]|nr:hypothetical protein [Pirellulales bacterium]
MGWRYEIGMNFQGPVDSAELRHLRATGAIDDGTLCYSDKESPRVYRSYREIAKQLEPAESESGDDGRPSEFFVRDGRVDGEIWLTGRRKGQLPF